MATATRARLTNIMPMAHVADVECSIEFYEKLGFTVGKRVREGDVTNWASLDLAGNAQLMLARTGRPMNPGAQDVLFYLYARNVVEYREQLQAKGIAVGEMQYPFWSPRGEFRVKDPDGYDLFVSHAD